MPSEGQNATAALAVATKALEDDPSPGAILFVLDTLDDADLAAFEKHAEGNGAPIVFLSVPFEHTASTLKGVRDALSEGQIVVSMVVPLATSIGDSPVRMLGVWQGSAAEMVASLVPEGVQATRAGLR